MSKYKGMKRFNGLVWRTWNYSLFGVKPDDDDIVQEVYNVRPNEDDTYTAEFCIAFSKLQPDGSVADDEVVYRGNRKACEKHFDKLADARVDPKMICYTSLTISE